MLEFVNCNLCRSRTFKTIGTKFGLSLVKCKTCGLIYTNPRPQELERLQRYESPLFFEEYLKNLKASPSSYDLAFIRNHYHPYLRLLNAYSAPGKNLLDLGCGAGFFLKAAEEKGWKVEGVEISRSAAHYARDIVRVTVHNGYLENLKLPSENYDAVTLLDILEHLPDPMGTLKEIHRILKREGVLILNTPDYNSLSRFFLGKDWAVLSPAEHLYNFTQKTLSTMLSRADFKTIVMRNLLIFNPDYTHNKKRAGFLLWKNIHTRLEETKTMENIHGFEYLDLMKAGREPEEKTSNIDFIQKAKRNLHRKAKAWLRGDILIAVAAKS